MVHDKETHIKAIESGEPHHLPEPAMPKKDKK
jgi:hypothetical protein